MRIGIVTDVHNDDLALREVLEQLDQLGIDQLVTLGDTCDWLAPATGSDEVAQRLLDRDAIGVWGNHDCLFHHNTPDFLREQFGPPTFEFIQRMKPKLQIQDMLCSHMESSVDANDFEQLWQIDDKELDLVERANLAFAASNHAIQLVGHYHRWWATTLEGPLDWDGSSILEFSPQCRYFVVIGAVFNGHAALIDTEVNCLTPVSTQRQSFSGRFATRPRR